jgi:hypothetical protein
MRKRGIYGTVSVDVDVSDVISEIDTDDLVAEIESRSGKFSFTPKGVAAHHFDALADAVACCDDASVQEAFSVFRKSIGDFYTPKEIALRQKYEYAPKFGRPS